MFTPDFIDDFARALAPKLALLLVPQQKTEALPQQAWFTRKQAAAYIGATPEALRHMLREGLIPVYQVSGRERISRTDLDQLWQANKQYLPR
jgi:excisionase family DNA binding protein